MGSSATLIGDIQLSTIMPVVALNFMVLLLLIRNATINYLRVLITENLKKGKQAELEHAMFRLDIFWMFALIAATAIVLQLVLPQSLADQIIAAWFVGQGFALQPYVQSFISGVFLRNNKKVWSSSETQMQLDGTMYTIDDHTLFTVTLKCMPSSSSKASNTPPTFQVLQWQQLSAYTFIKTKGQ